MAGAAPPPPASPHTVKADHSPPTADHAAPPQGRFRSIDALRGLAALSVVLLHFTTDFYHQFSPRSQLPFGIPLGGYGVYLFFVISGFVIFMTTERTRSLHDFAMSRFSRLYPVYWAALLITTLTLLLADIPGTPPAGQLLRRAVVNLSMVESWLGVATVDAVYWTLSVEMSFYVMLGLLVWRKRLAWAIPMMAGIVALGIADRLCFPREVPAWHAWLRLVLIVEHASFFVAGMVIFASMKKMRPFYIPVMVMCLAAPWTRDYAPNSPALDTLVGAALVAVVYAASRGWLGFLEHRVTLFLGAISYSLYVTHHWTGIAMLRWLDAHHLPAAASLALTLAACVALAWLLTRLVEQPALKALRASQRTGLTLSVKSSG